MYGRLWGRFASPAQLILMSMDEAVLSSITRWANFYVIVGSSAGALTGLQFVVITLLTQTRASSSMREIRAFGTPNVVHFGVALLISVLMCAPWNAVWHLIACLAAIAAAGFAYSLRVIWHAKKAVYSPDAADWFWFAILPTVMFMLLGIAAAIASSNPGPSFFLVAAISVVFLFNGIRNAWDTVTYLAVEGTKSGTN